MLLWCENLILLIVEVIDLVEVGIISASNSDVVWTKIEMISSDLIGDFELIFS